MPELVDKAWASRGLGSYSTAAIFGSLAHFGVTTDEAAFKALAEKRWPSEIAAIWEDTWEPANAFQTLTLFAAIELWRRFQPDRLQPVDLARPLHDLMTALDKDPSTVGPAFERVEALLPRLPLFEDLVARSFVDEAMEMLELRAWEPWTSRNSRREVIYGLEDFVDLRDVLLDGGALDAAERFVCIETTLYPPRRGVSQAAVALAKGDASAVASLRDLITSPPESSPGTRMEAIEALAERGYLLDALEACRPVLAAAIERKDIHLALDLLGRLHFGAEMAGEKLQQVNPPKMGFDVEQIGRFLEEIQAKELELKALHDQLHCDRDGTCPECDAEGLQAS